MRDRVASRAISDIGSQERTDEIIRARAYQLFEQRGGRHGNDLEDWLQAEAEVLGKKQSASVAPKQALKKIQQLGMKL